MIEFVKAVLEGDPWALLAAGGWIVVLGCACIVVSNTIAA